VLGDSTVSFLSLTPTNSVCACCSFPSERVTYHQSKQLPAYTTNMPSSNDPKYSHSHVSCVAGYYDMPNVNLAMIFDLKQFPSLSARIIETGGRLFELWSPNSQQLPFLLGERSMRPVTTAAQDVLQRRYDRHTGKHDCLYSPQYFLEATSHWAFIRQVAAVPPDDLSYPAFLPLTEGWNRSMRNTSEGVWDSSFIQGLQGVMALQEICMRNLMSGFRPGSTTWAARLSYCTGARFQTLLGVRRWDDAVDLGVAFQRGLREAEGWIRMIKGRKDDSLLTIADLQLWTNKVRK
jgi:hypothetical protein